MCVCLQVGAGIENSNYRVNSTIPLVVATATLVQPALIITRDPPNPIFYTPGEVVNYQLEVC